MTADGNCRGRWRWRSTISSRSWPRQWSPITTGREATALQRRGALKCRSAADRAAQACPRPRAVNGARKQRM